MVLVKRQWVEFAAAGRGAAASIDSFGGLV